jgi:hypothetical protein
MDLSFAKDMQAAYYDCERVLVEGSVKSYKIGNRELTRLDLADIRKGQAFYDKQVAILSGTANGRSGRMVVPRDL